MNAKLGRIGCWLSVFLLALVFYWASNVPTALTEQDVAAFRSMGLTPFKRSLSQVEEIQLVRKVQMMIFARSSFDKGIAEGDAREPANLLRLGYGLCFDRSRTFDKVFLYLGFQTRHVFLLYKRDKSFIRALISRGERSHAVTEVRLTGGWVVVDSLKSWISVTEDGELIDADHVWQRRAGFESIPAYLASDFWPIRGLYSRWGDFYSPFVGGPEISYSDFLGWVLGFV